MTAISSRSTIGAMFSSKKLRPPQLNAAAVGRKMSAGVKYVDNRCVDNRLVDRNEAGYVDKRYVDKRYGGQEICG